MLRALQVFLQNIIFFLFKIFNDRNKSPQQTVAVKQSVIYLFRKVQIFQNTFEW